MICIARLIITFTHLPTTPLRNIFIINTTTTNCAYYQPEVLTIIWLFIISPVAMLIRLTMLSMFARGSLGHMENLELPMIHTFSDKVYTLVVQNEQVRMKFVLLFACRYTIRTAVITLAAAPLDIIVELRFSTLKFVADMVGLPK